MSITKVDEKKLLGFEQALLSGLQAGIINLDQVDNVILQAGFMVTIEDHKKAKPVSKKEKASAMLAEYLDLDLVTGKKEKQNLLSAFGKYQVHCLGQPNESNGTSLVSAYVYNQLKAGKTVHNHKCLDYVKKYLPTYSSVGHLNTLKRMLKKAGYDVKVFRGGFSI